MHIYNIKTSVVPENSIIGTIRHHRIKAASPSLAVLKVIRREQYPLNQYPLIRTYIEVFRRGLRAVNKHAPIAALLPSDLARDLSKAVGWLDDFEKTEWDAK